MFDFAFGSKKELVILALIGFGLYCKKNEIDIANNTSILLILLMLFIEHEQIEDLRQHMCCNEKRSRKKHGKRHGRHEGECECGFEQEEEHMSCHTCHRCC